jgi:hypothetical protein
MMDAPRGADGYAGSKVLGGGTEGRAETRETAINGKTAGVLTESTAVARGTMQMAARSTDPERRRAGARFAVEPRSTTLQTRHGEI